MLLVIVNWKIIIISYRNDVPLYDILPDEEHDIFVINADYEIPIVTTDITVIPCPAYSTETEVIQVVTTACSYIGDVDTGPESIAVTTSTEVLVNC